MSRLGVIRRLVFGETWALPIAVFAVLVSAFVVRELLPELWQQAGGPLLLAGVCVALVVAVLARR